MHADIKSKFDIDTAAAERHMPDAYAHEVAWLKYERMFARARARMMERRFLGEDDAEGSRAVSRKDQMLGVSLEDR